MPSLRKRVSSYFRQLSFHNEPRDKRHNTVNENTFITKYLEGHLSLKEGSPIIYGKNPTDLPNYELGSYESGPSSVIGCYSGPNGGLTTVKRIEKHLSVLDADIDFIDTFDEEPVAAPLPLKSPVAKHPGQPIDNTTMVIKVAGHEYCVTNRPRRHSKSHSLGSISDFGVQIEKTKIEKSFYCNDNNNCEAVECRNGSKGTAKRNSDIVVTKVKDERKSVSAEGKQRKCDSSAASRAKRESYALAKSKSEGNPFHHKKKGRIIKIDRPNIREQNAESRLTEEDEEDSALPGEWNRKSDYFYGISDSLYDRNQVTRHKNGDPIADCFGIIARNDSAILAVADGVNWGEKASIAAKSAVHGSLHYLNKTIFNDTKPFEGLTIKTEESSLSGGDFDGSNPISNTREVFVCLLRAFNCAHDLILENEGMLTTLTVAVVLPLRHKLERRCRGADGEERVVRETQYVCCVCNVGDTLAYVYSQKFGMRELTKGSHDINCNRDMRDALGALGPVDGINPELSNLTISVTTLQKGDIVLVASDGLTDNFDPNVCRFAVNTVEPATKAKRPAGTTTNARVNAAPVKKEAPEGGKPPQRPPVKPPRRSKNRDEPSRGSAERSSVKSLTPEDDGRRNADGGTGKEGKSPVEADSHSNDVPVDMDNPLVAHFVRENSIEENSKNEKETIKRPPVMENKASSLRRQASSQVKTESIIAPSHNSLKQQKSATRAHIVDNTGKKPETGYKFLRSRTTIDMRSTTKPILRNDDGIPYITPVQRYELQLLLMEDILRNGISGKDPPCTTAKKLCENLVSYTVSITSAKRRTLEDQDLYYDNRNGVLVEVSGMEKKIRRKKGLERVQNLPGKLDHVTVVAYNVGNCNA